MLAAWCGILAGVGVLAGAGWGIQWRKARQLRASLDDAKSAMGRLERRLADAEIHLHETERLAELGTLTSGLAHEIKNPLSTVQLNLQLLSEDLDPINPHHDRLVRRLTTVQREAGRLRETLDDFLRYAGKMELDPRPVDLNILLEELVDFFSPQAQLQRVQLRLQKAPEPLVANVDPKLIKQAVLNLLLNALQAMPSGGELILLARVEAGKARIDVIDTGPGIAAEAREHIFTAYYSTKRGGTGLGLAIGQRIAREHGGMLDVTSEPGKGSDFCLLLPLARPTEFGAATRGERPTTATRSWIS